VSGPLLQVNNLKKHYAGSQSIIDRLVGAEVDSVKAVDGVSFEVAEGETLGLVGESGCGKSTIGETVLRLREATDGQITYDGQNLLKMSASVLTAFRQRAQIIFQDPFSSLDPRMTVGAIITEGLRIHGTDNASQRRKIALDLLKKVGLSPNQIDRYPHEFSGGQRQRIGIARALAVDPDFVVLDEPVSALDVSVQAQILNLLQDLQNQFDLTYLFIAHNLSVVRHICDRVAVMYLGKIVERGPVKELFEDPAHPYTRALLSSVPRVKSDSREGGFATLPGGVPSPRDPPTGCRFHTRCPEARVACRETVPPAYDVGASDDRVVTCFRADAAHPYWDSEPIEDLL